MINVVLHLYKGLSGFLNMTFFFNSIFACLDPDPDFQSGSATTIESGSETLPFWRSVNISDVWLATVGPFYKEKFRHTIYFFLAGVVLHAAL
jgi:hypothetical protein